MYRTLRHLNECRILTSRASKAFTDPGTTAGLRMMAEAGVRPEEFEIGEQLDAARRACRDISEPGARKAAMARVADLELRTNIAREARRRFLR